MSAAKHTTTPETLAQALAYVDSARAARDILADLTRVEEVNAVSSVLAESADRGLTLLLGDRRWAVEVGFDDTYEKVAPRLAQLVGRAQRESRDGDVPDALRREIVRNGNRLHSCVAVAWDTAERAAAEPVGYSDGFRVGDGGDVMRCPTRHRTLRAAQRCGRKLQAANPESLVCVWVARADGRLGELQAVVG